MPTFSLSAPGVRRECGQRLVVGERVWVGRTAWREVLAHHTVQVVVGKADDVEGGVDGLRGQGTGRGKGEGKGCGRRGVGGGSRREGCSVLVIDALCAPKVVAHRIAQITGTETGDAEGFGHPSRAHIR